LPVDAWDRRGRVGKATSNRIQSFFLRTSPTNDTALSDAREGLTPEDPPCLTG
jgi:hypothetical protein